MWHQLELCSPSAPFFATESLDHVTSGSRLADNPYPIQFESRDTATADQIDNVILSAAVQHFISSLNDREREIAMRLFWDDESQAEIGRSLGVSRMAICKVTNKLLARGRTALAPYRDCVAA